MIFIGNVIALFAAIAMVMTGLLKNKKQILIAQTIQVALFIISNILLGGIPGAIINGIWVIVNILGYKNKLGVKEKALLTIMAVILTFMFNNLNFAGVMPLLCLVIYLWLMTVKDVVKYKILLIITLVMWIIYDITIKFYSSSVFDFFGIMTNIITIIEIKNNRRKRKKQ